MRIHKVNWRISLSDGSFINEGESYGKYGLGISWQQANEFIKNKNLEITSLTLIDHEGRHFHLPSKGKNPDFVFFRESPPPIAFRVFRAIARELDTAKESEGNWDTKEWYTVGVAVYSAGELQIWVSEHDPRHSWSMFVSKETQSKIKSMQKKGDK